VVDQAALCIGLAVVGSVADQPQGLAWLVDAARDRRIVQNLVVESGGF